MKDLQTFFLDESAGSLSTNVVYSGRMAHVEVSVAHRYQRCRVLLTVKDAKSLAEALSVHASTIERLEMNA